MMTFQIVRTCQIQKSFEFSGEPENGQSRNETMNLRKKRRVVRYLS